MPHPGTLIETDDGERIEFVRTADDTGGELLEVRVRYRPHSAPPPVHYHPGQNEEFEVLGGVIEVTADGSTTTYRAGDSFFVPAGTRHRMHSAGDDFGEMRWVTRPALDTGRMFGRLWQVKRREASLGKLRSRFAYLTIFGDHRNEIRFPGLPGILAAAMRALSRLVRLDFVMAILVVPAAGGFPSVLALCAALLVFGCSGPGSTDTLPNVVFILADDMGRGDVQAYNSESLIRTPNINRQDHVDG